MKSAWPSRRRVPCTRSSARPPRLIAQFASLLLVVLGAVGCRDSSPPRVSSADARILLDETARDFHNASAAAAGAERQRLLEEAAQRYRDIQKRFPEQEDVAAEALRGLGSVYASLGNLDEAVKHYEKVEERYPGRDWEVLQAWKAAGDLLWEAGRRDEARKYYSRIIDRFDSTDGPAIIQQVVRGARARMAE